VIVVTLGRDGSDARSWEVVTLGRENVNVNVNENVNENVNVNVNGNEHVNVNENGNVNVNENVKRQTWNPGCKTRISIF
jgi:hypothetical protein